MDCDENQERDDVGSARGFSRDPAGCSSELRQLPVSRRIRRSRGEDRRVGGPAAAPGRSFAGTSSFSAWERRTTIPQSRQHGGGITLFIKLPTPTSTVTVAGCNIPQSRHIKIKSRHSEVGVRPVRQWGSGSRGRGTVAPPLFIKRPTPTATTMVGRNVPQSRHIKIIISKMISPNGTNRHLTYLGRIDSGTISRPQSRLENLPQSRVENLP